MFRKYASIKSLDLNKRQRRPSRIILCLRVPELPVQPVLLFQLLMGSVLYDLPPVKYQNVLAEPAGGQAVRDIDGRLVAHHPVKALEHLRLRLRVQRRRGFVHDHKGASL